LNGDAIDFQHTFVPSKYRGQGIAEKLVLVKSCSFILLNDNLILFFRML
jgi:predicted GNAT family acetyltransferase